ncbi:MAG: response regulator [Treponema sp.]|nr:response regulator [Treponema sp.]
MVILLLSIIKGFNVYACSLVALLSVFTIITHLILNKTSRVTFSAIFIAIGANNVFLPLIFFTTGGMYSGVPVWFILSLTFPWLLLRGAACYITAVINFIGIFGSIALSYIYPDLVIPLNGQGDVLFDFVICAVTVVLIFASIFQYQSHIYKSQEVTIIDALNRAQKATRAKTLFLTNVTHDIRTPLNAIIGFTEIARRNSENRGKLFDCLSKISVSSDHLLTLVNDVLEMSRIESGKLLLQYENESLKEIIETVTSIISPEFTEKNINFVVEFNDVRDDSILCDSLRMKQIFLNILNNAIKYSKQDGNIYFTINQTKSIKQDFVSYEFHIRDEGCGMTEEFLSRIYQPFERENTSTISGFYGSGLGLSITKNLVEMMGGHINVTSKVNEGTEFVINLTFEVPSLSEIKDETAVTKYDFHGKRILVVEDNDGNREIACEILKDAGLEVEEARDGSFAIEKIQNASANYYDAVLMDIQMPGKNGYETTKIIRSFDKPGIEDLPIIALSANVYEDDKKKAFEYGMNGYITKPFNVIELLKVLNFVIEEDSK